MSRPPPPCHEIATKLGLTENAVKVAMHRLRQRYRKRLRAELALTVDSPAEVDAELRYLIAMISA